MKDREKTLTFDEGLSFYLIQNGASVKRNMQGCKCTFYWSAVPLSLSLSLSLSPCNRLSHLFRVDLSREECLAVGLLDGYAPPDSKQNSKLGQGSKTATAVMQLHVPCSKQS